MTNLLEAPDLPIDPDSVKGFLAEQEGARLYALASQVTALGPCLEVGSYCGKSTLYLGAACRRQSNWMYAVDHHRGSEEHQLGEQYHDPQLYNQETQQFDSFGEFRLTLRRASLEDTVIPIVATSAMAGRRWSMPLGLVFIDGGHSWEAALTDYQTWAPQVAPGGFLAIHDLFPDPTQGGQAPIDIYRLALASGLFEALPDTQTLGVLRRL